MSEQNVAAEAFSADAGFTPDVLNVADGQTSFTTDVSAPNQKFFTEEDVAKIREQEKNKLYSQLNTLKTENSELRKLREEKEAREAEERGKREAEEATKLEQKRAAEEAELDVRDLLKKKEAEFAQQLDAERSERERAFAELQRERQYAELQSFRQQVLETERENIIPELLDLVTGESREEVAQSIESLKERSARILESAQAAMQSTRKEMTGTKTTLPPAGPLDINSEQRNFTAAEIASMPMAEYQKYRQRLLSDKAQGRQQGLFGN